MAQLDNISPEVFAKSQARADLPEDYDDAVVDPIDTREIFGELRILDLDQESLQFEIRLQISVSKAVAMAPIEINSVLLPGHQPSPLQHPPLPLPPPLIPLTSTVTPPTSPPSPFPPHHTHPSHHHSHSPRHD